MLWMRRKLWSQRSRSVFLQARLHQIVNSLALDSHVEHGQVARPQQRWSAKDREKLIRREAKCKRFLWPVTQQK